MSPPSAARPAAAADADAALRATALVLAPLLAAIALGFAASGGPPGLAATADLAAADLAAVPPWASKRSPLNVYAAKVAWGWTTALFAAALALCAPARAPRRSAAALLRYALATAYWVAMARWFFGPPLFDRVFARTGGACLAPAGPGALRLPAASLQACRQAGGTWAGGHDVSGHCFLLIHSALFLAEEALAPLLALLLLPAAAPRLRLAALRRAAAGVTAALLGVWVFMLYVTARYFHGGRELASGTAVAAGYWAVLHVLRRSRAPS
ncbi:hypothetical protein H4R18_003520 [Coemansia javaensis]|uniref:Fat storage-inducing transmembrane protein n=1 Tax=Coemansia javaensis TaxID=2761396 RepID=A0A9W8HA68_9FUNG|nr:hypothetical protein H4R18_003520 [Coemansia javaensis]